MAVPEFADLLSQSTDAMQVIDAIGNAAVDSGEIDMRVIKIASEAKAYYYGGITFGGIALLILVLVVWQRKNIKTAVGMLQETARALRDMPFMKASDPLLPTHTNCATCPS